MSFLFCRGVGLAVEFVFLTLVSPLSLCLFRFGLHLFRLFSLCVFLFCFFFLDFWQVMEVAMEVEKEVV